MSATLFTVGHSDRPAAAFVALLGAHGIHMVVDVRRFPGSRRHPQFGSDALAATLERHDIGYLHEPALGGRRGPPDPDSPNTAWRVHAFRAYADYALTAPFQEALEHLLARGASAPTVVMCAEAVWWRCHRRLIADQAVARGWRVVHLLGSDRVADHDLHPDARVRGDGALIYPAPVGGQKELWEP